MDDSISRRAVINALNKKWVEKDFKDEFGYGFDSCLNWMDVLIRNLPSANQWIPCSERMPEEDGRYLCTYSDFGICVDFGLYTDGQWIIEPIAWMPLPQPWKGEEECKNIES